MMMARRVMLVVAVMAVVKVVVIAIVIVAAKRIVFDVVMRTTNIVLGIDVCVVVDEGLYDV